MRAVVTGPLLSVFLPGKLSNPLNASGWGLWAHRRWAKSWRSRMAERLRVEVLTSRGVLALDPDQPKLVNFYATVFNHFDSDGLEAALKPCRDALKDARIIRDDAERAGNVFHYWQKIDRKAPRGVRVTVEPRGER